MALRIIRRLQNLLDVDWDNVADGDALVRDGDTITGGTAGGGGGAPTTADYLVGTAQGDLSAEIVVGTSPGGELGGTWASPTVDATHSGSSHAAVQAAAEVTAAAALASHVGAADPHTGYRLESAPIVSADIQDGTIAVGDLAFDPATQAELDAHLNDTTDAHAGTAITNTPAGNIAATTVQAALNELDTEKAALAHLHAGEDITSGTVADARIASTIARDSEVAAGYQPLDSDLTAIAALTTTSFGRALLELANQAALLSAAGAAAAAHTHAEADVTGLVSDLAGKQPLDSDLTAIAALTPTNDDIVQRKAGAWTNRTIAQLLTDLAAAGTTFQPLDSDLTAIAALTTTSYGRALLEAANLAALYTILAVDTDGTLAANSDVKLPSQKAAKTYADTKVAKTVADANSVLYAVSDDTPAALTMAASTILARLAAGNITAATPAEIKTLLAIASSDVSGLGSLATLSAVASAQITDGSIVNGDINAAAAIAHTKLALTPDGRPVAGGTTHYSIPGVAISAVTTTGVLGANVDAFMPFYVTRTSVIDQLAFEQTAAAAAGKLIRVGIVSLDDSLQPVAVLFDSGSIAADGANAVKTVAVSSLSLAPGKYAFVYNTDGSPTLRQFTGVSTLNGLNSALGANSVNLIFFKSRTYAAFTTGGWDSITASTACRHVICCRIASYT